MLFLVVMCRRTLSSCGMGPPLWLWYGVSSFVVAEFSSRIMVGESPLGNPLWLHQRACGSSRVSVGNSEFFSNCSGKLGVPLKLKQGSWASSRAALGNLGVSQDAIGELCLISSCRVELSVSLMMQWETQSFFQAVVGTSGFLLSCNRELRIHLMLLQGNQASSKWRWEHRGYS